MINVTPDHPIAHEEGFFIAGIYPNFNEGGFNRLDWLAEYEQLQITGADVK
ncbi:hypothetical protein Q4O66_08505 [Acinetobacter baumannii]|uniref:hypothetical protein n=1 Tax=Acinetobacter baumannii TaxID=470 RepID=UPI00266F0C3C|nr:hypothetical protein [Acinetobacter baumannii]MDO5885955.1 hypothetical protein [Acinetobacter baumannii]HDV0601440.1 hypothetical protein [Acinetobacter baumannii]